MSPANKAVTLMLAMLTSSLVLGEMADDKAQSLIVGSINVARNKAGRRGHAVLVKWHDTTRQDSKSFNCLNVFLKHEPSQHCTDYDTDSAELPSLVEGFIHAKEAEVLEKADRDGVNCYYELNLNGRSYISCIWSDQDDTPGPIFSTKICRFCPSKMCPNAFDDDKGGQVTDVNLCLKNIIFEEQLTSNDEDDLSVNFENCTHRTPIF